MRRVIPIRIKTKFIHGTSTIDPLTNSVNVPVYQTSTFKQEAIGVHKGFEYARTKNPTRSILEDTIAGLENGAYGFTFSSGLAAISTLFALFKSGDHVIVTKNVYGGSYRLLQKVFHKWGITATFVNTEDINNIEKAHQANTVALFIETPTNPLQRVSPL
ncbi:MAG: PLP-dependent transferase, partial [Bacilli bacterium]